MGEDKNAIGKLYRAIPIKRFRRYRVNGDFVPERRPWAGCHDYKTGFGVNTIHNITAWVTEQIKRRDYYDVLVSYTGSLNDFYKDPLNSEVYKNQITISLKKVVVEEVSQRVTPRDVEGLSLSEKVQRIMDNWSENKPSKGHQGLAA